TVRSDSGPPHRGRRPRGRFFERLHCSGRIYGRGRRMTNPKSLQFTHVPEPDRETLLRMYERMRLIRTFEDNVHDLFAGGAIPGFVHLYAGEEAVGVGVMFALNQDDYITSTHRGHGHCIAKGVDLKRMLAEIYGKSTGFCKGKGGSMH